MQMIGERSRRAEEPGQLTNHYFEGGEARVLLFRERASISLWRLRSRCSRCAIPEFRPPTGHIFRPFSRSVLCYASRCRLGYPMQKIDIFTEQACLRAMQMAQKSIVALQV